VWTIVNAPNLSQVIDREALLDRVGGDQDFLQEIASLFLEDCPKLLADVRTAVSSEDARGLEHAAHALKGSVANFGAEAARQAASRLETLGRAGDLKPAPEAYSTLEQEIGRFTQALGTLSRELSAR
jgi:HPt (histidine-containing phosphotransfer) domain-containing protein